MDVLTRSRYNADRVRLPARTRSHACYVPFKRDHEERNYVSGGLLMKFMHDEKIYFLINVYKINKSLLFCDLKMFT